MIGFKDVSQKRFFSRLSDICQLRRTYSPALFAVAYAYKRGELPFNAWRDMHIWAVPTPNKWGWAYMSLSQHGIVWTPDGTVYAIGLDDGHGLLARLAAWWGPTAELPRPAWLDAALRLMVRMEAGGEFLDAIRVSPLVYLDRQLSGGVDEDARRLVETGACTYLGVARYRAKERARAWRILRWAHGQGC